MKIDRSTLIATIKEVLDEISATGGGSFSTPGIGAQYSTPKAFKKKKSTEENLVPKGYKRIKRPSRPSHTKLFDFLQ